MPQDARTATPGFIPPAWTSLTGLPVRVRYRDAADAHAVLAEVTRRGADVVLAVTESPAGSAVAADAVRHEDRLADAWEVRLGLLDLEARLVATGGRYTRVNLATGERQPLPVQPRPPRDHVPPAVPASVGLAGARVNHYHRRDGRSILQLTLPRADLADRCTLAALEFAFPDAADGRADVVHARLAPALLPHAWVRHHSACTSRGFRRLATPGEFTNALGAGWEPEWARACAFLASRAGAHPPPVDVPPPAPRWGPVPAEVIPAGAIADALADPRVAALARAHLGDEAAGVLVERGETAIRRYFAHVRGGADPREQFDLRIVEAALLTRFAIATGRGELALEEGRTVVRMLRSYVTGGARVPRAVASGR